MAMSGIFEWEPVEDNYYPGAIMQTGVAGLYYDFLHVEQSNEGWHALFLNYGDDFMTMDIMEEQVLDTELKAQAYAEEFDLKRMGQKVYDDEASEEEEQMWLMAKLEA